MKISSCASSDARTLAELLEKRHVEVQESYNLPLSTVVDEISARVGADVLALDPVALASSLHVAELMLAIACTRGDEAALSRFEATYGPTIDAACRRFSAQIPFADARQRVFERLLFSERPGIATYAGTGELAGWVRVSAVRCLISAVTRVRREEPIGDELLESLAAQDVDAEMALIEAESSAAFKKVFAEAFEQLTNREKSLLRYAYVDGLGVDRIGRVYRVHRATAARWIQLARAKLVAAVVEGLVDRLDIATSDVASVLRVALSMAPTTVVRQLRGA